MQGDNYMDRITILLEFVHNLLVFALRYLCPHNLMEW